MAYTPKQVFLNGIWLENPIYRQGLGICSTLAVTNLLANTLFMCFGLIFTTALSNFTISVLRDYIPKRIRMIVQVLIIACYVMMVDIIIKALVPDIHRFIGPYVGLIITNCIIMGRAEAFASQNKAPPFFLFFFLFSTRRWGWLFLGRVCCELVRGGGVVFTPAGKASTKKTEKPGRLF